MKTAYDRGYETGLGSLEWELPMSPYHYNQKERGDWIEGFCRGWLAKWRPSYDDNSACPMCGEDGGTQCGMPNCQY